MKKQFISTTIIATALVLCPFAGGFAQTIPGIPGAKGD